MKQQCYIATIYLSWAAYLGGLAFFVAMARYPMAIAWLVTVPLAQWVYMRRFPKISYYLGYGQVTDKPARLVEPAPIKVILYTALGCPFCPLVEQRLETLQKKMGFSLEKIDVTLKRELLANKGIRAVPVIEAGRQHLVGNVTSDQIATLILSQRRLLWLEKQAAQLLKAG